MTNAAPAAMRSFTPMNTRPFFTFILKVALMPNSGTPKFFPAGIGATSKQLKQPSLALGNGRVPRKSK